MNTDTDVKAGNVSIRRAFLAALLTFIAFSIRLKSLDISGPALQVFFLNLIGSFQGFSVAAAVMFPCLFLLYYYLDKTLIGQRNTSWTITIPSVLFALFIVFGISFEENNSWNLVIGWRKAEAVKAALVFLGYFVLFKQGLRYLFFLMDRITGEARTKLRSSESRESWRGIYAHALAEKPFRTVLFTLIAVYIPYALVSYPALFMGDTTPQITQAFSELKMAMGYMTPERLLSDSVYINQHHPVAHTMLIHWCILLGDRAFHSFNAGIFIYCIIQEFCFMTAIAYAAAVVFKTTDRSMRYLAGVLVYCFVHPLIHNYMFLVTKDIIYTAFFILLLVNLYLVLSKQEDKAGRGLYISIGIACAGMLLLRNDSRYILILSFLVIAVICRKLRKAAIAYSGLVLLISLLFFNILLPALYITPGSTREMLSVPFQQTARYVLHHGDEVTEEEKDAIDGVLDYDVIAKKYDPNKSDNVKSTFNEDASMQDLLRYFRAWTAMLAKHPGTYIQATMNNYYQYFFPGSIRFIRFSYDWSATCMERANNALEPIKQTFSYPKKTAAFRSFSDLFFSKINSFPVLSLLMTPAVYTWILIVMFFYAVKKKRYEALSLVMIPLAILLICVLGPCNGNYGRYTFPIVVILPFLIPIYLDLHKKGMR